MKSNIDFMSKDFFSGEFERTASSIFDQTLDISSESDVPSEKTLFDTSQLLSYFDKIKYKPSPSNLDLALKNHKNLESSLFDACARIKVKTSSVSMYLDKDWKEKFFRQLDLIHDPEDWDEGDDPINIKSFDAFIKWFIQEKPIKNPGFGLSHTGNLIAAWVVGEKDRLSIEFTPSGKGNWAITRFLNGDIERAVGSSNISRLSDVLGPYNLKCFLFE